MKKILTLALGLSLFTGSSVFAAERPRVDARNRGRNDARNVKKREDNRRDRRAPERNHRVESRGKR